MTESEDDLKYAKAQSQRIIKKYGKSDFDADDMAYFEGLIDGQKSGNLFVHVDFVKGMLTSICELSIKLIEMEEAAEKLTKDNRVLSDGIVGLAQELREATKWERAFKEDGKTLKGRYEL